MVIMVYIIYLRQDFFNFCTIGSKPFIVNSISITIVASHFDTLNTKIGLLFHILDTEIGWCEKKWEAGAGAGGWRQGKYWPILTKIGIDNILF